VKSSTSKTILITALMVFAATPLVAHHSVAKTYDSSKPITMSGTVKEVRWLNPHASMIIEVKGTDGKVSTWEVEMAAPNTLFRTGFRKETAALSSLVTMQVWPARDGSRTATGLLLTLADGKQFDIHDSFGDFLPRK